MSGESFGEALRELMTERGIGVRALARQVPCNPGTISKLCRDERGTSEAMAKRLDAILGSDDRLLALFKATTGTVNARVADGGDNEDVERRTLLGLMAAAVTAGSMGRDAELLRGAFETAVAADASDRDADTWERVAFDYANEVGWAPAAELQPELAADFAELTRLVPTAPKPARVRLIHVAAQIAALMAINLTNLGDGRSARRWWRTAARAADQTGDHAAAARIRGRAAVISLYTETPRLSVIEAAEESIMVGRGDPGGVVNGHAAKAQAFAELGRHDEAKDALDDLRGVFERLPEFVRTDRSSWGWSAGRLHFVTSFVHTCAGNLEPAMDAQDAALAVCSDRGWKFRSQIEMHRAGALIRAGDVDEGARHMTRVLERLPAEWRGDRLVQGSAVTSLRLAGAGQAGRPSLQQARELLKSAGDR
ncbi:helix-turn-helix domain-containing protein [Actinomadura decatromicini]|uniref:Helix-turn-helix domain-containing protein n=1 Tax=Actinomadura decatromicini TaxID=2604572 RepID=A0A5D3FMQ0_9ACTN|nr:helix-turn-helix transcriptional regulator [Actinomadura decatromicini]TYK49523.1 helix-turn-helix domain-containing protein [Actinomadura decatromicini]